jgi:drug/metabolite transporter (DMT)-like permease
VGLTNDAAVIPLALGAAGSFAVANVAQMRAARRAEGPTNLHPNLLLRLVRDPLWIGGLAASVVGFVLQAIALYLAPVVLVQPLIVTELLFALPLAASLAGVRLHAREWLGALLVAAGISCFVFVGQPSGQSTHAAGGTWLLTTLSVGAGVVLLGIFAESRRGRPALRASALAAAASVCFGFLAVLTKVVGHQFGDERLGALTHPQPWLMAVAAIGGLLLAQTAFRIAPLSVSLPLIDVGEPLIGSVLAVLILGERLDVTSGTVAGVVISAVAIAAGVAVLDTSPRVHSAQQDIDKRWDPASPDFIASATH